MTSPGRFTYDWTRCRDCQLNHEDFADDHRAQFVLCEACRQWHATECRRRAQRIEERFGPRPRGRET